MQPNACSIRKLRDDMTPPQQSGGDEEPPRRRNDLPQEIVDVMWPALQVGGLSGMSGMTIGAFAGVIRSSTPALFALASGIQWFTLGTTFWASRGFVLHAWGKDKVTSKEKIYASSIAGGIGGGVGGLLRGKGNIIPGSIMFAIFGAIGQAFYNIADARNPESSGKPKDLKDSWLNSKWSPMKVLSDADYEKMLQEKLLKVNAEIALVSENIAALRVQEEDFKAKKEVDKPESSQE